MNRKNLSVIIGNWKMNPETLKEARKIFSTIKRNLKGVTGLEVVICPPFIFLDALSRLVDNKFPLKLGVQNAFGSANSEKVGSYTGEISVAMLKEFKVSYLIAGHSERRMLGETDEMINKKVKTALAQSFKVVVCVGERQRDSDGKFFEWLRNQIRSSLQGVNREYLSQIIIAYEPVWAIGKSQKEAMSGKNLYEMNIFVKKVLSEIFGKSAAFSVPIIYGGSVGPDNVLDIVNEGEVSGILPGRASLDPLVMKKFFELMAKPR